MHALFSKIAIEILLVQTKFFVLPCSFNITPFTRFDELPYQYINIPPLFIYVQTIIWLYDLPPLLIMFIACSHCFTGSYICKTHGRWLKSFLGFTCMPQADWQCPNKTLQFLQADDHVRIYMSNGFAMLVRNNLWAIVRSILHFRWNLQKVLDRVISNNV